MAANNTKEGHAGIVSLLMKEHTNTYKAVMQKKTLNFTDTENRLGVQWLPEAGKGWEEAKWMEAVKCTNFQLQNKFWGCNVEHDDNS